MPSRKLQLSGIGRYFGVSVLSSLFVSADNLNPLMTNGLSHPYHLDESTFIFRDIGNIFFSFFI